MKTSLTQRLVLVAALPLLLAGIVLSLTYARDAKEQGIEESVEKARAIVLSAESAREEMGDKWNKGLFTQEQLRAWAAEGRRDKVLAAVPVVTAWNTAMRKAAEGGYEFRVPKFSPRNPKNAPDETEARVLKMFEADLSLKEHFEVDETKNSVRYFRPIKLTTECLNCHGDPQRSQELWGNDRGIDPTGGPMENWKVGEVHGAFEVVQTLDEADSKLAAMLWTFVGLVCVLLALGTAGAYWFGQRAIVRPLDKEFDKLAEGAQEVLSAATQMADSSQQLAQNATEQAGVLEQTTGSMDAMGQKTRENASNSGQAAALMTKVEQQVARSNEALGTMVASMAEIEDSSQRVADIIKTIDEIAFQTNVLALNAAVEAARAGDAGLGFAVVADEVRSLAQRSAQAARGTAELIETAITRTQAGTAQVDRVASAISEITGSVTEAKVLIDRVSSASQEQSADLERVAASLTQIEKVTQTMAATAEESAAASEELSAQAKSALATVGHGGDVQAPPARAARPAGSAMPLRRAA